MKRTFLFVVCLSVLPSLCTEFSIALPRFALLTGAKCGSCHINPTGGQMRSDFGVSYSTDVLPLRATRDEDFSFNPKLSESISIGADYRTQFIYDQALKATTFQSMGMLMYGSAQLSRTISLYAKFDLVNGTYGDPSSSFFNGTEVYGLARILPEGWYIKGGVFLPDYGWRMDDHTAYIRGGDIGYTGAGYHQSLLFIPNYKDIGGEVGGYIGNLSITAGLFNGTGHIQPIDFSNQKAYSAKLEYMSSLGGMNLRVGVSGYGYRSFKLGGFHAGIGSADSTIAVLAEADWTHEKLSLTPNGLLLTVGQNTMAAMIDAYYRLIQGLWLNARFDIYDPLQGRGEDEFSPATNSVQRIVLGLEFFPYSFVEVRPQYRIIIEKPGLSNDQLLVQMHLWF